ncbi:MAG: tRNA pseudouridine(54/55) synthase Pus10 [Candidatus Thorarchaeota archaeon]
MSSDQSFNVIETARKIIEDGPVCDRCLGRQFGWLSTSSSNLERGKSIKLVLSMQADYDIKSGNGDQGKKQIALLAGNGMFEPAEKMAERNAIEFERKTECRLCSIEGISVFDRIPNIVERALEKIQGLEYNNILIGCKVDPKLVDVEDELRAKFNVLYGESLKSDFNRELGKQILARVGKDVEFKRPDLVIGYNMAKDRIWLQISPIFIYGRYRKLKRGIPQSRWDCKACHGKGCELCGGTGRKYPDSISEYIGIPMKEAAKGTRFKLHAAGREDIDVLMLGEGRPFVVEISEPKIRTLDLEALAREVNERAEGKVEIHLLKMTRREVSQLLQERASQNVKEYEALIRTEAPVDEKTLRLIEEKFRDITIEQRTPTRVAHRRADKIRIKRIYEVRLERVDEMIIKGNFRVQGGTYVKELVSGDDGRTRPSIAELLGAKTECIELNVTAIYETEPNHNP